MKHSILTLFLIFLFSSCFSQEVNYEVRGIYARSVTKESFRSARLMSDVISGYPIHWITGYTSVEISATCGGKALKAVSANDTLTAAQINLLHTVDLASTIDIRVKYSYKVPVTGITENNTMHVSMTIVPETEAEYAGGYEKLIRYLKVKSLHHISASTFREFQQVSVKFTVNEEGKIINAKVTDTFGDTQMDALLLKIVEEMPNWKPAANAKGIKVKQEFVLNVGRKGGC